LVRATFRVLRPLGALKFPFSAKWNGKVDDILPQIQSLVQRYLRVVQVAGTNMGMPHVHIQGSLDTKFKAQQKKETSIGLQTRALNLANAEPGH
jgi:hypothetical protein